MPLAGITLTVEMGVKMADPKVRALKTARDEWSEAAIERLEQALEIARVKPLETVAIFYIARDGQREVLYSSENVTLAVGGLFTVAADLALLRG